MRSQTVLFLALACMLATAAYADLSDLREGDLQGDPREDKSEIRLRFPNRGRCVRFFRPYFRGPVPRDICQVLVDEPVGRKLQQDNESKRELILRFRNPVYCVNHFKKWLSDDDATRVCHRP